MKVITAETLAAEAYTRWMKQYPSDKDGIGEMLLGLGENPNPEDVDNIIGNCSWTSVPRCNECESIVDKVIMLGEEPDYESYTIFVCDECIKNACSKIKE